jgi:hypothetical protein
MSAQPLTFEAISLLGGPLDGAHVLIGTSHDILHVHTQTSYDDSKADQHVDTHRYHYTRTKETTTLDGFTLTVFKYLTNLKDIPQ